MEVVNRLLSVVTGVGHDPITGLGDALFFGELNGDAQNSTEQVNVRIAGVVQRYDMPVRDDEHVRGRLCVDVAKGGNFVVLIKLRGGQLPGYDLTEDTIGRHSGSSQRLVRRYTRDDREYESNA